MSRVMLFLTFLLVVGLSGVSLARAERQLTIGEIELKTTDIFSRVEVNQSPEPFRFMRSVMNGVHIDTRTFVLRRELLFRTGDPLKPELLEETARNLRRLGYLNRVIVAPVDTLSDGSVSILVEVREAWTLRTQFSLSIAGSGNNRWNMLLSDSNFLGLGMLIGMGMGATEDSDYKSLVFRNRRIWASSWRIFAAYFDRTDGFNREIELARPFRALDDRFGVSAVFWDRAFDARYYLTNAGPSGLDASSSESLYALVPKRSRGVQVGGQIRVRGLGGARIWRLGFGARLREMDLGLDAPTTWLSDDRYADLSYLESGRTEANREQGTEFYPYVVLSTVGRKWATTTYLLEYGQTEDVPLEVTSRFYIGPRWLSNRPYDSTGRPVRIEFTLRDWNQFGNGFLLFKAVGSQTVADGRERTGRVVLDLGWFHRHGDGPHPRLTRMIVEAGHGHNLTGTQALLLGLIRGIRTMGYDGMAGDRLYRWNIEHGKVLPYELFGFFQSGVGAFYGGGVAWWQGEERSSDSIRHEVGFGVRLGPTRAASGEPARIDVSWALDGSEGPVFTATTRGLF